MIALSGLSVFRQPTISEVTPKVEAIRRYQEETRQETEAMTGAVLERAFRGSCSKQIAHIQHRGEFARRGRQL